jgi:hypothetical protein
MNEGGGLILGRIINGIARVWIIVAAVYELRALSR